MKKNKLLVYPATWTNFINMIFIINAKDAKEHILCDSIYLMFRRVDRLGRRMIETYRVLKGFCVLIWMIVLQVYTSICTVRLDIIDAATLMHFTYFIIYSYVYPIKKLLISKLLSRFWLNFGRISKSMMKH